MAACRGMVEQSGARIAGFAFLIELDFLGGRSRLAPHDICSLIHYGDERA